MSAQQAAYSSPAKMAAKHSLPLIASVRQSLHEHIKGDSDLDAFCLDYFPAVHAEFTVGMQRTAKLNLLLTYVSPDEVLAALRTISVRTRPEPMGLNDRERRNRQRMLDKVRKFWIEGVLEKSLYGAVMIELGKEYRPDAVAYPWDMVVERLDAEPQPIPKGTKMMELFDGNLGELLILGAPGSGKTTMLLDLCRDLLQRAAADVTEPIPAVFHLSSWEPGRQPLVSWLTQELRQRYDVPYGVATAWLSAGGIVPLLDGLDELPCEVRRHCVEAIRRFRQNTEAPGLVVCCRCEEYAALAAPLRLNGAISLAPLSSQQVDLYLQGCSKLPVDLGERLRTDPELCALAMSPLMLNMLAAAYSSEELALHPQEYRAEQGRRLAIAGFVRKMLRRRSSLAGVSVENLCTWLSVLAKWMLRQNQSIFYLEEMQPSLLESRMQSGLYRAGSSFGFWFIILLLRQLLEMPMIFWRPLAGGQSEKVSAQLWILSVVLIPVATVIALLSRWFESSDTIQPVSVTSMAFRHFQPQWAVAARHAIRRSLPIAAGFAMIDLVIVVILLSDKSVFLPAASMTFKVGLFVLSRVVDFGILYGFIFVITFFGYLFRFSLKEQSIPDRSFPNRGIHASAKSFAVFLVGFFLAGLSFVFVKHKFPVSPFDISSILSLNGLMFAITGASMLSMSILSALFGGLAVARHCMLRLILSYSNKLPLALVCFLDQCVVLNLCRRVGGGYLFVHRLLLDYFASLTDDEIRKLSTETTRRR